ncbi:unnamed protein product [Urochloa decumbens]|uniref:GPI inositol-deacylase n=1 Tax=Urochloa decumbens TaxID=240449 RepID=A0ABC8X578_9POAL
MLRRVLLLRRFHQHRHRLRQLSTTPTPPASPAPSVPSTSSSSPLPIASRPPPPNDLAPRRGAARRLAPLLAFSTLSLAAAGAAYLSVDDLEETLRRSRDSAGRVVERMQHTLAAARVLSKSLLSVLSSANQEVRSGFELRVAALLADITAASAARRAAIVSAGGGAVVDWLLDSVVRGATQAEAARALAHLVADPWVAPAVLGRPHAVPCLLQFIFSYQPTRGKKKSSFDSSDHSRGRSMLVAALMDIITSNCDNADYSSFQPLLPADADTRDIAAVIEVIEQGGMHFDDHEDNSSNDGDTGLKGIGIKVLGGTTILGFSRGNNSLELDNSDDDMLEISHNSRRLVVQRTANESPLVEKLSSSAVPGLWDDLQREHVAVPFATWALANWAIASDLNRTRIQELDSDGHAVATALKASERTVKWHGTLVARSLLEDQNLALAPSVPDWCSSLLSTASQATENNDMSLGQLSLSTFLLSMTRSNESKFVIRQKGLHPLRSIAKRIENQNGQSSMKESIASALSLLYAGEVPLSLEESQRWSGILLRLLFDKSVSDKTHLTAVKILSCILEYYGPASVPISQGWLALVLSEILGDNKAPNSKGGTTQPEQERVKNPVDYHNASTATQVLNQLGSAVVKLASAQSGYEPGSDDKVPLADFLSLEPFATALKNLNKKNPPKFDAADSASATLKGIKALAELCSEDGACQKRIADLGALSLLRHILLGDDYEKLAAIEAYDASRIREVQGKNVSASNVSTTDATTDPSSVRVPPAAHIRRHAGRLLTILSLLPNSKKQIISDDVWCKWLEDCASGRIPCNDIKLKSYCRLTLLNIFCSESPNNRRGSDEYPGSGSEYKRNCPQFGDALFLLNPELPLEVHLDNSGSRISSVPRDNCKDDGGIEDSSETGSSVDGADAASENAPLMDVVFVHGLRGGPFNSWRIADDKSSTTKAGLVESIDEDAGKEGTCWPREWLATDFPQARFFTLKYKTNLTQWTGASLPLQEVSSMLLRKMVAAGIGSRPVIFVTHSMGGLVVKQLLYQAKLNNYDNFLNNTVGLVFYSCPHFGSKLADMPWRMGLVFRPAPSIGELRSGSPRLVELNDFVRQRHNKGLLDVLSFSETQVTPIVEGYGGWALRMEIVPIESAYPGFGELVVLASTDHINSCKPVNKNDPSYAETLAFLEKNFKLRLKRAES